MTRHGNTTCFQCYDGRQLSPAPPTPPLLRPRQHLALPPSSNSLCHNRHQTVTGVRSIDLLVSSCSILRSEILATKVC